MTGQKTKMAIAAILAVLTAFLPIGLGYILFPDQTSTQQPAPVPIGKPEPVSNAIIGALELIGLATLITVITVSVILFARQSKNYKIL